jgi:hypothetical protein
MVFLLCKKRKEMFCMEGLSNFIKETFSMQEKRVSTIIISLLVMLGLSFYLYLTRGDIPETLLSIVQTLIYMVAGINGINVASKIFNKENINNDNEP